MGSGTTSSMRREYWTETTECSTETTAFVFETTTAARFRRVLRRRRRRRARARVSAVAGVHGLDAALRRSVRSLFPGVERDLDRSHREHRLADTGRGAVAGNARGNAMDASAAARGGSAADDSRGGAAAKAATDDGGNNPFSVPAYAIAARDVSASRLEKTEKEKHSPAFSPLRDMRAGIGDALQYAAQVFPRSDKADRKFAQAEMAFAVAEDVALAAVFAGRPAFAAAAVVRLAWCFVASPSPAPTDAASLLGLVAAVMPEGEARARGAAPRGGDPGRGRAQPRAAGAAPSPARRRPGARSRRSPPPRRANSWKMKIRRKPAARVSPSARWGVSACSSTRPRRARARARRSARAPWRSARAATGSRARASRRRPATLQEKPGASNAASAPGARCLARLRTRAPRALGERGGFRSGHRARPRVPRRDRPVGAGAASGGEDRRAGVRRGGATLARRASSRALLSDPLGPTSAPPASPSGRQKRQIRECRARVVLLVRHHRGGQTAADAAPGLRGKTPRAAVSRRTATVSCAWARAGRDRPP